LNPEWREKCEYGPFPDEREDFNQCYFEIIPLNKSSFHSGMRSRGLINSKLCESINTHQNTDSIGLKINEQRGFNFIVNGFKMGREVK
jgi:hypothetical protein